MKVEVNQKKCIGCGACVTIANKSFRLKRAGDRFVSQPIKQKKITIKEKSLIAGAVNCCPVKAIKMT